MTNISDKEAFATHLNYADCVASLVKGATLTYAPSLNKRQLPLLEKKANLIALTLRSLKEEKRIVDLDHDYSIGSTLWLPVKGYYLLFNVLLTIEYIINVQPNTFTASHTGCLRIFTKRLKDGDLQFNQPILNSVVDGSIFSHRDESGANLSRRIGIDRRYRIAMAKIADYKEEEWKRQRKIPDFRSKANRQLRTDFRNSFACSIFEFPYFMRVRANYRDFAFIEGVSANETAQYFQCYYDFIMGLYQVLARLQSDLIKARA